MNSVVNNVIQFYDEGKISLVVAKKIIQSCENGVDWCNEDRFEAYATIRHCRCGNCLKKIKKGDPIYLMDNLYYDSDLKINNNSFIDEENGLLLVSDGVCEDCLDQVIQTKLKPGTTKEQIREELLEWHDPNDYISEGTERSLLYC